MTTFLLRIALVVVLVWSGWVYGVPTALGYLTDRQHRQDPSRSKFLIDGHRYRSVTDPCGNEQIEIAITPEAERRAGEIDRWVPLRRYR